MTRLALPPLYAIVDPLDTGRSALDLAATMLAGGARVLQLRLKDATAAELLGMARSLLALARPAGALVIVNDRPDVARAAGAHGVHLGQTDVPVAVARAILPAGALVGVSTHDPAEAMRATAAGADYLGVGPLYPTGSKPDARPARGPELVRTVRAVTPLPLVAIGGITPQTAPAARLAGADAVAMIAALVRAPDVAAAVRAVLARLAPG